jgi:peptide/nickel transport system substrate-binding protein
MRSGAVAAVALFAGAALAGCGGGSSARGPAVAKGAGTIRMALAGVPTLDPARAMTPQQTELDWALYTGLVTYRHARGSAGTELIPGVARALPGVSDGGRLYRVSLRRGLRFSDGRPLRAADVVATIERAILIQGSPVRRLLLGVLDGAEAFSEGEARSISGVTGDDASGTVTIRLRRPDPAFDALLAEPALGIVPAGTPVRGRPRLPAPGAGPYRLRDVRAGSFTLARNPYWTPLPGIPAGQVNVEVVLTRDASASAVAVLNDVLDIADPAQEIPRATLAQIRREGTGRLTEMTDGRPVAYVFLDTRSAPFDARAARKGVVESLGAQTLGQAAARSLSAICDVVPAVSAQPAPDGCPAPGSAQGALGDARSLVAGSGTAGELVSVWSPRTGGERAWLQEQVAVLRSIGYAARLVTVPDATYRSEVARPASRPSRGVSDPDPGGSRTPRSLPVRAVKSSRSAASVTADAVIDGRITSSVRVPATDAVAVAVGPDGALGHARRHEQVVFADQAIPLVTSSRMQQAATVINPVEGLDFTSLRLR